MITFCPKCYQKYEVDNSFDGQDVECGKCGFKFTVSEGVIKLLSEEEKAMPQVSVQVQGDEPIPAKKIISTVLIVLSIIFLFGGTFTSLIIGKEYTTSWRWCIFIANIIISANFVCWGLLLDSLNNIESILSKKK